IVDQMDVDLDAVEPPFESVVQRMRVEVVVVRVAAQDGNGVSDLGGGRPGCQHQKENAGAGYRAECAPPQRQARPGKPRDQGSSDQSRLGERGSVPTPLRRRGASSWRAPSPHAASWPAGLAAAGTSGLCW